MDEAKREVRGALPTGCAVWVEKTCGGKRNEKWLKGEKENPKEYNGKGLVMEKETYGKMLRFR